MTNDITAFSNTHWPEDGRPLQQGYVTILGCMYCGNAFAGPEPKTCCDGRECGCMGGPVEPVICSPQCWEAFHDHAKRKNLKPQYLLEMVQAGVMKAVTTAIAASKPVPRHPERKYISGIVQTTSSSERLEESNGDRRFMPIAHTQCLECGGFCVSEFETETRVCNSCRTLLYNE